MALSKTPRRWIASLLAVVLVCLQLATAAYACAASGVASEQVVKMADMPDCPGMTDLDDQSPQLCKAHCDRDKQSVNTAPAADLAPLLTIDWLLSRQVSMAETTGEPQTLPAVMAAHTGPPQGAPPVYLAYLVLRH